MGDAVKDFHVRIVLPEHVYIDVVETITVALERRFMHCTSAAVLVEEVQP